jgi:ribosomal protein S27AE
MPRDGAIILSDLVGKVDVLRVNCEKCGRDVLRAAPSDREAWPQCKAH